MTDSIPDPRFEVLAKITRAQHFAWRDAVDEMAPDLDVHEAVLRMWEITGEQTANAYRPRLDPDAPLPEQLARCIAWSSRCMGEDAVVETPKDGHTTAYVRHRACPWHACHAARGLDAEDRAGCDRWFQTIVHHLNTAFGTQLSVETLESLPDGDPSCLRRITTHP